MAPATLLILAIALPSAALMGLAIQRGATCMVAAVSEVVTTGKAGRALALGEASLWVAGGLALASLAGVLRMAPSGHAVGPATLLGGVPSSFRVMVGILFGFGCGFFSFRARYGKYRPVSVSMQKTHFSSSTMTAKIGASHLKDAHARLAFHRSAVFRRAIGHRLAGRDPAGIAAA